MVHPRPKFKVAICGGGIGGLALAIGLSKYNDIHVEIYEAAQAFTEIGAGIGVWPRVWNILEKFGVSDDLAALTPLKPTNETVDTFVFRKSDQAEGNSFYTLRTDGAFLRYHRPDVLRVLENHLPSSYQTHFCKRLQTYHEDKTGTIHLQFEDGSTTSCDILCGADGLKSNVRKTMLTNLADKARSRGDFGMAEHLLEHIEPRWTGITAFRALVPTQALREFQEQHPDVASRITIPEEDALPTMYMGQHVNVVVYPISSGRLINVGCFHADSTKAGTVFPGDSWMSKVDKSLILDTYATWEPQLHAILQCMDKPLRWAIHSVDAPIWVDTRVACMGDAAHAMSPQQASGAGQAIEDAYVLCTLLGHRLTNLGNVSAALAIYNKIRRPMATEVQQRSLLNGELFGLQLPGLDADAEPERLHEVGERIKENWKWAWTTSAEPMVQEAVALLEQTLSPLQDGRHYRAMM